MDWSTIPWQAFRSKQDQGGAWTKERVPYKKDGNDLQTLDIWIPMDNEDARPDSNTLPPRTGTWVIYIHGGAWRDPAITASSFAPTVRALLSNPQAKRNIAGLASLSYSLSPHPSHPDNPSPPKDPNQPKDPSRMATHPDHIVDVLNALKFIQEIGTFGSNYVLLGHSCGATLAFQVAMDHALWNRGTGDGSRPPVIEKPAVIVGLNGLYDLPALIHDSGTDHRQLIPIYTQFTKLAFGEDEKPWREVSPFYFQAWSEHWTTGTKAVLAQSHADSLVPYRQTQSMLTSLNQSGSQNLAVVEESIDGDHNDIWQQGERLAEIILKLVGEQ